MRTTCVCVRVCALLLSSFFFNVEKRTKKIHSETKLHHIAQNKRRSCSKDDTVVLLTTSSRRVSMLLSSGDLPVTRLRATSNKGTRKKKFSMQIRASSTTVLTEYFLTTVSLSTCACLGAYVGTNTRFGKKLSGPVCSMLMGYIFLAPSNNHVIPINAEVLGTIRLFVSAVATPLILLGANLNAIRRTFRTLLQPFLFSALATIGGAFVGVKLFLSSGNNISLAAALVAKNIGSGINYVASCQALGVSPQAQAQGLVVDNVFAFLYFPLVSILGDQYKRTEHHEVEKEDVAISTDYRSTFDASDVKMALALTLAILIAARIEAEFWSTILEGANSSRLFLPVVTLFSVLTATFFKVKDAVVNAGNFTGQCLLYVFFASAGASSPPLIHAFTNDVNLLYFASTMFAVHLLAVGLLFSSPEMLVASNAGVGGPATAAAFAKAKNWRELVAPAILVGNLGNACGTFIAIIFAQIVN